MIAFSSVAKLKKTKVDNSRLFVSAISAAKKRPTPMLSGCYYNVQFEAIASLAIIDYL